MRKFSFLSTLLALALLAGCAPMSPAGRDDPVRLSPAPSETPAVIETPAPSETPRSGVMSSFSATDLEDNEVDQSIFADHDLTMVNIWATFCSPCLDEMPDLGELHAEYADKGFQIVGLVADVLDGRGAVNPDQLETAKAAVEKTGANYRHLIPSEDLFGLLSQASSVPTTFFVDKDGMQVGKAYIGSRPKDIWKAIIDETLAEVKK